MRNVEIENAAISDRVAKIAEAETKAKYKHDQLMYQLEQKLKREHKDKLNDLLQKFREKQDEFDMKIREKETEIIEIEHQEKFLQL